MGNGGVIHQMRVRLWRGMARLLLCRCNVKFCLCLNIFTKFTFYTLQLKTVTSNAETIIVAL